MTDFYHSFYLRYQREGSRMSIKNFCLREGVPYFSFMRWYRSTRKLMLESEPPFRVTPIHVTDSSLTDSSPLSFPDNSFPVVSFQLRFSNGTEISKENSNLPCIIALLENLLKLC